MRGASGVEGAKLKGDSVGNTREVPIADYVDVGVFGDRVPGQKLGELLLEVGNGHPANDHARVIQQARCDKGQVSDRIYLTIDTRTHKGLSGARRWRRYGVTSDGAGGKLG